MLPSALQKDAYLSNVLFNFFEYGDILYIQMSDASATTQKLLDTPKYLIFITGDT